MGNNVSNCYERKQSELVKADIGFRIGAFIIDHILILVFLLLPFMFFYFRNVSNEPPKILSTFTIVMLVAFFVYCLKDIVKGQSPGKYMLGIAVRNRHNPSERPLIHKLLIRNIFTFIWPMEFLVLLCSENKTKIGDSIVGTDVYRVSNKVKIPLIIATIALVGITFIGAMVFGIAKIIKSDQPYVIAVNHIEMSPEIINTIGEIKGYGLIPSGNVVYSSDGSAEANYIIKVFGMKSTTHVQVQLERKPNREWEIIYFNFR
ncbi:MAG: RDD family protein [Lachnospiraceae bacterium]|jgi:uncharacterized RDD family membrane protein YckC|nr:RDD family protein [Lachnospiraceae bacterium]